jgi:hypothetical protein
MARVAGILGSFIVFSTFAHGWALAQSDIEIPLQPKDQKEIDDRSSGTGDDRNNWIVEEKPRTFAQDGKSVLGSHRHGIRQITRSKLGEVQIDFVHGDPLTLPLKLQGCSSFECKLKEDDQSHTDHFLLEVFHGLQRGAHVEGEFFKYRQVFTSANGVRTLGTALVMVEGQVAEKDCPGEPGPPPPEEPPPPPEPVPIPDPTPTVPVQAHGGCPEAR